jgi:hypothetical protein
MWADARGAYGEVCRLARLSPLENHRYKGTQKNRAKTVFPPRETALRSRRTRGKNPDQRRMRSEITRRAGRREGGLARLFLTVD